MAKEHEIKKVQQSLKEKSKEENVKRHQRRLEYKKELYLQKLKTEEQTFNEARKLKNDVIQERYYNHMIDQIKKDQVKETVEHMQHSKKFDKSKIEKIAEEFQFMTEGALVSDHVGQNADIYGVTSSKSGMFSPVTKASTGMHMQKNRGQSSQMSRAASQMFGVSTSGQPPKIEGGKKLQQALRIIQRLSNSPDQSKNRIDKAYTSSQANRNYSQTSMAGGGNNLLNDQFDYVTSGKTHSRLRL